MDIYVHTVSRSYGSVVTHVMILVEKYLHAPAAFLFNAVEKLISAIIIKIPAIHLVINVHV